LRTPAFGTTTGSEHRYHERRKGFEDEKLKIKIFKDKKGEEKMRKSVLLICLFVILPLSVSAQNAPELEFALQLKVTLGETFSIENTQHGRRTVIPITGGTFEGPLLKGTIINGGADYQIANAQGRTELEAIYCIKTDDGVYIHVRNRGIISNAPDANGQPSFYFKAAPQFEAPADSKYGWLNNALFVCAPDFSANFKGIVLNVWKVK
jgi:hypothetical protein